eukprot:Nk52_evm80s914 gene=Nk52_evmTU80s914
MSDSGKGEPKKKDSLNSPEQICIICCDPYVYHAIGNCQHRGMCHICCLRMRVFDKQKYCPQCRTDWPKVIFTKNGDKLFADFKTRNFSFDRKEGILYEDIDLFKEAQELFKFKCKLCNYVGRNWNGLKEHVRKTHDRWYCEQCTGHLSKFIHEFNIFTKKELQKHRREGDDISFKGHAFCKFCNQYFFGNDQLYDHLKKNHFSCHLCENDGIRDLYFPGYNDLEDHFRSDHFLCEDSECLEKKFIVFRTKIDLKGHQAEEHIGKMKLSQAQARQARQIDTNFAYRNQQTHGRSNEGNSGREGGRVVTTEEDFPSLSGSGNTGSVVAGGSVRPSMAYRVVGGGAVQTGGTEFEEMYPSLGGEASSSSSGFSRANRSHYAAGGRGPPSQSANNPSFEEMYPSLGGDEGRGKKGKGKGKAARGNESAGNSLRNRAPPGFGKGSMGIRDIDDSEKSGWKTLGPRKPKAEQPMVSRYEEMSLNDPKAPSSPTIDDTFVKPPNFEKRNQNLIKDVRRLCDGSEETFNSFKSISALFRKGQMPADDYFEAFLELFGDAKWRAVYTELVTLLPDTEKQKELLRAKKDWDVRERQKKDGDGLRPRVLEINTKAVPKNATWGSGGASSNGSFMRGNTKKKVQKSADNTSRLECSICEICSQVVSDSDLRAHNEYHIQATGVDYPSLSIASGVRQPQSQPYRYNASGRIGSSSGRQNFAGGNSNDFPSLS